MQIRDIMIREPATVSMDTPIHQIADRMTRQNQAGLPVVDRTNRLVGWISEQELLTQGLARVGIVGTIWRVPPDGSPSHSRRLFAKTARDVMTPLEEVPHITENETLGQVLAMMASRQADRVPVLREGKLVGLVTVAGCLRAFFRSQDLDLHHMLSDAEIATMIIETLHRCEDVQIDNLNVRVFDGVARVTGRVGDASDRAYVQELARALPGVHEVITDLSVADQPMSSRMPG